MGFSEIATFLVLAAIGGIIARLLKQPLLVGYLFSGIVLSLFGFIKSPEAVSDLGKIGVALLLFLVGLEMKLGEIPTLGKVALMTGLGQIIFTSVVGFSLSVLLGFSPLASVYIAVALTFSSTIIIVKLLSEKGDLGSLYGKISVGFLLVQDLVAVLILMFLAGIRQGNTDIAGFLFIGVKALILFALTWYLSKGILPRLFERLTSKSPEILFMAAIAWALGISALVGGPLGFSYEIGGFLAGLALSNLPEHLGISAKTRPLRDFFLVIFFLSLGSQLIIKDVAGVIFPAVIFSLFVLIGNPLIVMAIMGAMRYKKRTSFLASVTVAQISEFSFILMAMGLALGHVGVGETATVIVVGIFTMIASTYLILGSEKIYTKIKIFLSVFERKNTKEDVFLMDREISDHIVLIGANRMGSVLIKFLKRKGEKFLVIDHNPKVFSELSADNIPVLFGDCEDSEVLDLAKIGLSRLVISSIPHLEDNLTILEYIKALPRKPVSIFKATTKKDAAHLYEAGASYVLVPEVLAGEFLRHVFLSHGISPERIKKMGKSHFRRML
ncbi:MAG: Sodium/hydrogen exchanger [Candidatus Woesebacteria bacterium GW2011_GWB1_45_5]|uniref:Sodium/hydrogen exchanger n=1 Tax=Candidatus Woesebacteria bacterium GW2011_GWB1_45_5 TaxID=1618581 RepID=A0A0G1MMR9_9BACT|nr:MAG: Sodium/hydrogen exchanger [Candidatus Woesebacteria bacterium GW2011_GWB1_45_5]